jgi:hypothetical protein
MRPLALLLAALAAHGAAAQQLYNARGEPIGPAAPPPPEQQPLDPPPSQPDLLNLGMADPEQNIPRQLSSPAGLGPLITRAPIAAYTTRFSVPPSTEWNPGHQRVKSECGRQRGGGRSGPGAAADGALCGRRGRARRLGPRARSWVASPSQPTPPPPKQATHPPWRATCGASPPPGR